MWICVAAPSKKILILKLMQRWDPENGYLQALQLYLLKILHAWIMKMMETVSNRDSLGNNNI